MYIPRISNLLAFSEDGQLAVALNLMAAVESGLLQPNFQTRSHQSVRPASAPCAAGHSEVQCIRESYPMNTSFVQDDKVWNIRPVYAAVFQHVCNQQSCGEAVATEAISYDAEAPCPLCENVPEE